MRCLKNYLEAKTYLLMRVLSKFLLQESINQDYMWVLAKGHESDSPYRIYDFRENRCHNNVLEILKDYRGGLHLVKYNAYQWLAAFQKSQRPV